MQVAERLGRSTIVKWIKRPRRGSLVGLLLVALATAAALLAIVGGDALTESAPVEPRPAGNGRTGISAKALIRTAAGQVRTADQLLARARNPASDGKMFLVRAGAYGELDLRGVQRSRLTVFRAYPGERPVIGYTTMGDTQNLRFQGLRFAGAIDIQPGINRRIQLVDNDIGGYRGAGVSIRERSSDILIKGNRFHDLTQLGGNYAAGYGVRASSPTVEIFRLSVVGNKFTRLGNDAMEFGGVNGLLVERNEVSEVKIEPGSGAHSDPLFLWAGSRRAIVRGNRFHDNSQPVYLTGGLERVVFENNLVARSDNYCMQVGGSGRQGDRIEGLRIHNNTVWHCGFGGILFSGASPGWSLTNNLIQSLHAGPPESRFETQEFNLIGRGPRRARDRRGRPRFVDAANADYRLRRHSPGIDAGKDDGAPNRDQLGNRRWDDPSVRNRGEGRRDFVDIGAYERRPQ